MLFKTVAILMVITFVAGAIAGNYIVDKGKQSISGITKKEKELNIEKPIAELPQNYDLPTLNIEKINKITIVLPSERYGTIKIGVPIYGFNC